MKDATFFFVAMQFIGLLMPSKLYLTEVSIFKYRLERYYYKNRYLVAVCFESGS